MSRIFDAILRGGDDTAHTVISSLETPGQGETALKMDAEALVGAALQNLPTSETPGSDKPGADKPAPIVIPFLTARVSAPAVSKSVEPRQPSETGLRTIALKVTGHSPLLPFDTTNWRASEQYRTIRTRILQDPQQPRMIAVSSGGAGDGKSVTAINIAGALSLKAQADVLLVDADFRRSSIHTQMSLPVSPGLTDILLDRCTFEEALIRAEQFPNFYILPAGTRVENPSDLLEDSRWAALHAEMTGMFRYTVLDCPPVGAVSEWDLIQAATDSVIVVGRQDHTKLSEFLKALESVPRQKLLGVVLNCVSDWFLMRPQSSYDYPRPVENTTGGRRRWF